MADIKLKNKAGKEQVYTNITKIKLPLENNSLQVFSEGEPAIITSNYDDPIKLDGNYDGSILELTKGGTLNLTTLIKEQKLPLKINVNVTKPYTEGTLDITNTDLIDVSSYTNAKIVDSNLVPENIKEGVTILGVTGTFKTAETEFDSSHTDYESSIQAKLDYSKSAAYLLSNAESCNDCEFLRNIDFSVVTESQQAFYNCKSLTTIPYLNTCNSTNMSEMFMGCTNLVSVEGLDTSKASRVDSLFKNCASLKNIPPLDLSAATSAYYIFNGCSSLTEIPRADFSKLTYPYGLFSNCSSLVEVPSIDLASGRDIDNLFSNCTNLKTVGYLNTDSAGSLAGLFSDCHNLETVTITRWRRMLREQYIDGIANWAAAKDVFKNCYSLKEIIFHEVGTSDDMGYAFSLPDLTSCYHFTGTVHEVYNPTGAKDGIIRVPEYWLPMLKEYSWSSYADMITALEDIQTLGPMTVYNKIQSKEMTIKLYNFESIPKAMITSSDSRIVTVTNVIARKNKVTFRLNFTGKLGKALINVNVEGDHNSTYSFPVTFENYYGPTYRVEDVEGARYNFVLNSEGYYESINNNKNSTDNVGLCRLIITNNQAESVNLELDCINHNRGNWGDISLLDTPLSTSEIDDASLIYKSFKQVYFDRNSTSGDPIHLSMPSPQRVIYEIPTGEHFIDIKFVNWHGSNENDTYRPNNFRFRVVNFIPEELKN